MWTSGPADRVLRYNDHSLDPDELAVSELFGDFLRDRCPPDRVRTAEPLGFDPDLWAELDRIGALTMVGEHAEDLTGLVPLVLAAEQLGGHLAPVPWVEHVVAVRALMRCAGSDAAEAAAEAMQRSQPVTFALREMSSDDPQLVPAGAVAGRTVALLDGRLVLVTHGPLPLVHNQACSPLGWLALSADDDVRVLAVDEDAAARHEAALAEWKLLTAAQCVGLSDGALRRGVEFATQRTAFGEPIGAFQAVSHALADVATAVEGARRLVRKAAWHVDAERPEAPSLTAMAFVHAARTAARACRVGVHVQGGFGVTSESDLQLFFRRASGWPSVNGDPELELDRIAGLLDVPVADTEGTRG